MATPGGAPLHRAWTEGNQSGPPAPALDSPLLALHMSSDVDPVLPEQIDDARAALRLRRSGGDPAAVSGLHRRIVERFLAGRRAYFGAGQCRPLHDADQLAAEGRDIFVVVKFMDEAPHLRATLHSLLNQQGVDPRRVVVVAVDNNSTDGSDRIVAELRAANHTPVRLYYLNQSMPGAGNAARLGVDACIATVHQMCVRDGAWGRLQTSTISVSDGDTVYHPHVLREVRRILDEHPTVDAVMPFLTYKSTAALRLFADYLPALPEAMAGHADPATAVPVGVDLSGVAAHDLLPRAGRRRLSPDLMVLTRHDGATVTVPLAHTDEHGRRFGLLRDSAGRLAYLLGDRTLVLAEAPVSGFDAALVFLENGGVRADEKGRWHALIGHDAFLYWAFAGMGLPVEVVYPDTSDALKTVRVWSFAVGGQHQLRRPGLRIATGSDYQSGRVLQATGCTVCLGPADAYAETEIDRLIKMVRNLVQRQAVFYGETRSASLDRATGLYVHMTRIQGQLEGELRGYADEVFSQTVFPERVLFPLRWILQNAARCYAQDDPRARQVVRERVLRVMFPAEVAAGVEHEWFGESWRAAIRDAEFSEKQAVAEHIAEAVISTHHGHLMTFYGDTLRSFLAYQSVPAECYGWLLEGLETWPNAMAHRPPAVDPAVVWDGSEFIIDVQRGQVVGMRTATGTGPRRGGQT